MDTWGFAIGAALYLAMTIAAIRSAYSNGANDGYGYARDPSNPGYQRAGRCLYEFMSHRYDNVPKPGDVTHVTVDSDDDEPIVTEAQMKEHDDYVESLCRAEEGSSNGLAAQMHIIELEQAVQHYRDQVTMHHNGMVDISIMLEEGSYDEARDKALSFIETEGDENGH